MEARLCLFDEGFNSERLGIDFGFLESEGCEECEEEAEGGDAPWPVHTPFPDVASDAGCEN